MKLLSRGSRELPGVTGVARVSRRSETLLGRVGHGDIVVTDHLDIDRKTAEALVRADVTAVVNASPSVSGRYPNLGPEILVASGVLLLDGVGDGVLSDIKDGAKVRIHEGAIFIGENQIAVGTEQTPESIADLLIDARAGMSAQLEAFAANAIEYMKRERSLLLDGVGIPVLATPIAGRQVLLVGVGGDAARELKSLRSYIKEYRPVLIGVDAGADLLRSSGYTPDIIVANPENLTSQTLTCGAEVVIPAHVDGHAPGLERVQDLGVGAVTFPATGTSEDLALLLADDREASLIVTVGLHPGLTDLLDRGSSTAASSFLVRLRVSNKLVQAPAVATFSRVKTSWWAVLLLLVVAIGAMVTALLVFDVSGTYADIFRDWWDRSVEWLKGLF